MKRHYIELWLLLATAFIIFAVTSAFELPSVAGHQLKSSGIASALTPAAEPPVSPTPPITPTPQPAEPAEPAEPDTLAHTILFIGDSMLDGLSPRLAAYCDHNGHKLYSVVWYSSTSEVWGKSSRLRDYIAKIQPTYIFICLGANELFIRDIQTKRQTYIDRILRDIGDIPYLWIGPPNWKRDTGINRMIASSVRPGAFFLSDGMDFERSKDGAHPTPRAAALWLDSVARWMPRNSFHPIRMETPEADKGRPARVFVHQPSEE